MGTVDAAGHRPVTRTPLRPKDAGAGSGTRGSIGAATPRGPISADAAERAATAATQAKAGAGHVTPRPSTASPDPSPSPAPAPAPDSGPRKRGGLGGAAKTAPVAPAPTPEPQQVLDQAIDIIGTSPTGAKVLEELRQDGVEITISTDADYAAYNSGLGEHGTILVNPAVLEESPEHVAGVLTHEAGHALLDHRGVLPKLDELPDGVGPLANEVIAESLASAVAREAGIPRTASAISRGDGTFRAPAQGFDDIMKSSYIDYYGIDLANFTAEERQTAYDEITTQSLNLLGSLGATPPQEFLEGAEPKVVMRPGGWLTFDVRWTWTGQPERTKEEQLADQLGKLAEQSRQRAGSAPTTPILPRDSRPR